MTFEALSFFAYTPVTPISTPEPLNGIWPPFFVGDDRLIAQIVLSRSNAEPPHNEGGQISLSVEVIVKKQNPGRKLGRFPSFPSIFGGIQIIQIRGIFFLIHIDPHLPY